jgi:hypothetical protein
MYFADLPSTSRCRPRASHVMFLPLGAHDYNHIARTSRISLVSGAFVMFVLKHLSLPASEIPLKLDQNLGGKV